MITVVYAGDDLRGSSSTRWVMNRSGLFWASREANTHLQPISASANVAVSEGKDFRVSKATQERALMPFSRKATAACTILSCNWL